MTDLRDRRVAERFPVNADSACDFMSPVLEDIGAVRIKNISNEGIGLIANHEVAPGMLLAINLVNRKRSFSKTMLVRVAHVTPQAGNSYLIGGTFKTPLTYEELTTMVM
jgi:hypothetical protein